jgi:hypothetical protein
MPPEALISSAAISSDLRTVVSLPAITPEVEFKNPTLMVLPEVSTQLAAEDESPDPHAVRVSPSASADVVALAMRRVGDFVTGDTSSGSPFVGVGPTLRERT